MRVPISSTVASADRSVLQAMAVGVAGLEADRVAGPEDFRPGVGDERDLAGQHIDELVRPGVPVTLARPGAGRQAEEVDAELGEAGGVAELLPLARQAGLVEGRRIHRPDDGRRDRRCRFSWSCRAIPRFQRRSLARRHRGDDMTWDDELLAGRQRARRIDLVDRGDHPHRHAELSGDGCRAYRPARR